MKIEVLFFGMSRDLAGKGSTALEVASQTDVQRLKSILSKEFPMFSKMESFAIAINESYAEDKIVLSEGDVVAIIPPVSGG